MATAQCARTGGALIERLASDGARDGRAVATSKLTRRLIVENGVTYNVYADPQGRRSGPGRSIRCRCC